jgi:hypothetical protein
VCFFCLVLAGHLLIHAQGLRVRAEVGREQLYLSIMQLSVHINLSLCDEACQVWDGVGDIYKKKKCTGLRVVGPRSPPTWGHQGSVSLSRVMGWG